MIGKAHNLRNSKNETSYKLSKKVLLNNETKKDKLALNKSFISNNYHDIKLNATQNISLNNLIANKSEKQSNYSSVIKSSFNKTDNNLNHKNLDKQTLENSSSFLENQFVLLEEPFEKSRIMPITNQYVLSFTETKLGVNPIRDINFDNLSITQQNSNILSKFILAITMVLILSLIGFIIVKFFIESVILLSISQIYEILNEI